MAGYCHPNNGNFAGNLDANQVDSSQLDQEESNMPNNSTPGATGAYSHTFSQQPAYPAAVDQAALGTGWHGPTNIPHQMLAGSNLNQNMDRIQAQAQMQQDISGVVPTNSIRSVVGNQTFTPNNFGPLIQNPSQYPHSNRSQTMPAENFRYDQNQQNWHHNLPRMNDNYLLQLHNGPPMQYQNPFAARTASELSASAALQPANNDADNESDLEEDFLNPDTGRPVRKLLDHEKVLLKHFFYIKNPLTPIPSKRQVHLWQLNLPDKVQDEWIQFVVQNQTLAEALDRQDALEEYRKMILAMKDKVYDMKRSEYRGSRHGQLGRPVGSQNKPKNQSPAKKTTGVSKRMTPTKRATSIKFNSAKKGKKARRQVEENDDDDFDPNE